MKFIGIYSEGYFYTDESNCKRLYAFIGDLIDVIILYKKDKPFYVERIGILLDECEFYGVPMYSVWEYEYFAQDEQECKNIAISIAGQITKFFRDALRYLNDTETITILKPAILNTK